MNKEIIFRASRTKLVAGIGESAILSWDVQGAKSVTLSTPENNYLHVSNVGKHIVTPQKTAEYAITAKFQDGTTQTKHFKISVLETGLIDVDVYPEDNYKIFDLQWNATNAYDILLDGEKISPKGHKKYLVTNKRTVIFEYKDEFGKVREKYAIIKYSYIHRAIRSLLNVILPLLYLLIYFGLIYHFKNELLYAISFLSNMHVAIFLLTLFLLTGIFGITIGAIPYGLAHSFDKKYYDIRSKIEYIDVFD